MLNHLLPKGKDQPVESFKFQDFFMFWQIFASENKVPTKVKEIALQSLVDILADLNDPKYKESFVTLSLENIEKGQNFLYSLIFLRKVLITYPPENPSRTRYTTSSSPISLQ